MVNIQTQSNDGYDLLEVTGEVDASSSIQLDNAITNSIGGPSQKVVVDLTNLTYISSAGLGVFISHLDDLKTRNKSLVLFGLNDKVFEVFRILGLEQIIKIVKSKEEALAR